MECKLENRVLICTIHNNLVSINIRTLLQEIKQNIDYFETYDVYNLSLKECKSIDSMGITFLIGISKTLLAQSKKMILSDVPDSIIYLFKIMKLNEVFEFQNS